MSQVCKYDRKVLQPVYSDHESTLHECLYYNTRTVLYLYLNMSANVNSQFYFIDISVTGHLQFAFNTLYGREREKMNWHTDSTFSISICGLLVMGTGNMLQVNSVC